MTKLEIAQRIADDHNRLANILASGGMKLLNADSAILLGDTIKDLRALAQQLGQDIEAEAAAEAAEIESKDESKEAEKE